MGCRAIGQDLPLLDLVARPDDGLLIEARPFVEALKFAQGINVGSDFDPAGIDVRHFAGLAGADHHARVAGHVLFHARGHDRRLGDEQRHGLPLHVRAHQGAVGIVVLQEGNQAG